MNQTHRKFKTVLASLGLTESDFATMHDIDVDTVQAWCAVGAQVPEQAWESLQNIEGVYDNLVSTTLQDAQKCTEGQEEGAHGEFVFLTFESDEELWAQQPEWSPLPANGHREIARRIHLALVQEGFQARLKLFDSDEYQKWVEERGNSERADLSLWAQVA